MGQLLPPTVVVQEARVIEDLTLTGRLWVFRELKRVVALRSDDMAATLREHNGRCRTSYMVALTGIERA